QTGGSIAAIIYRLHYADHPLDPLRRSQNGSIAPISNTCYFAYRKDKYLSRVTSTFLQYAVYQKTS
ncbi:MAG TPA: hypothetical protein PK175_11285, partial [Syntrophales bacterium]|nr:hypothetical protein [Syntrophales bacterium]